MWGCMGPAGLWRTAADSSRPPPLRCLRCLPAGTFAGQIPVVEVDGRRIGDGARGPVTARLQALYAALCDEEAARGR